MNRTFRTALVILTLAVSTTGCLAAGTAGTAGVGAGSAEQGEVMQQTIDQAQDLADQIQVEQQQRAEQTTDLLTD